MKLKLRNQIKFIFISFFMISCQKSPPLFEKLNKGAKDDLLCQQNFDAFNNRLYDFWLSKNNVPSFSEFKIQFQQSLEQDSEWSHLSALKKESLVKITSRYYQFLTEELTQTERKASGKLQLLAALELGDTSEDRQQLQKLWAHEKKVISDRIAELQIPCPKGRTNKNPSTFLNPRDSNSKSSNSLTTPLPRAVEGLRRAIATAYQSCESMEVPALQSVTPEVEGIRILKQTHPDGIGRKRVYGNISKILGTHPYYQFSSRSDDCLDTRSTPLIYDYGGKPDTSTDSSAVLDFFTDQGSGTEALGIDCSGFIFSALARGGLKLDPEKALKPVLVYGISARMYKDPGNNGLGCFDTIPEEAQGILQPGDIIATKGHVVMIDQVGEDPLGLKRAHSIEDCDLEHLNSEGFDFIIAHSTPWKGGVGINRSKAADYFQSASLFKAGVEKYALFFCKSLYGNPKGSINDISELTIVRHSGTPECYNEETIGLKYESCVAECNFEQKIVTK